MSIRHLLIVALLGTGFTSAATAAQCRDGELQVSFSNLRVREAFGLFAHVAGLRPQVDASIEESGPLNFGCTHWRVAAEDLARQYNLRLKIEGGVLYVTRESSAH
jgi:hypothetical protein